MPDRTGIFLGWSANLSNFLGLGVEAGASPMYPQKMRVPPLGSEGAKLVELMSDHELEQVVHFPTRGQNTLDLIITSLPGQFVDIHSPDRLSDHDIVSGTLKIVIPPIKKPKRKVYKYQKGDYESMKGDALKFANERRNISTVTLAHGRFKKTLI